MGDARARLSSPSTWSEYEAQGGGEADLASLPEAVRAIVEESRAQTKQTSGVASAKEAPYPCRMYEEAGPGEEDMLQLQWMRVDVRGKACCCCRRNLLVRVFPRFLYFLRTQTFKFQTGPISCFLVLGANGV